MGNAPERRFASLMTRHPLRVLFFADADLVHDLLAGEIAIAVVVPDADGQIAIFGGEPQLDALVAGARQLADRQRAHGADRRVERLLGADFEAVDLEPRTGGDRQLVAPRLWRQQHELEDEAHQVLGSGHELRRLRFSRIAVRQAARVPIEAGARRLGPAAPRAAGEKGLRLQAVRRDLAPADRVQPLGAEQVDEAAGLGVAREDVCVVLDLPRLRGATDEAALASVVQVVGDAAAPRQAVHCRNARRRGHRKPLRLGRGGRCLRLLGVGFQVRQNQRAGCDWRGQRRSGADCTDLRFRHDELRLEADELRFQRAWLSRRLRHRQPRPRYHQSVQAQRQESGDAQALARIHGFNSSFIRLCSTRVPSSSSTTILTGNWRCWGASQISAPLSSGRCCFTRCSVVILPRAVSISTPGLMVYQCWFSLRPLVMASSKRSRFANSRNMNWYMTETRSCVAGGSLRRSIVPSRVSLSSPAGQSKSALARRGSPSPRLPSKCCGCSPDPATRPRLSSRSGSRANSASKPTALLSLTMR